MRNACIQVLSKSSAKIRPCRVRQMILSQLTALRKCIDHAKPFVGPSRTATATARLSSMIGDGNVHRSR